MTPSTDLDSGLWPRMVKRAPFVLLALGLLVLLPRIGSFGFWDPSEVRVADAARALLEPSNRLNQVPPTVSVWLVALGFGKLGVTEIGGRLPLALCSLLALLFTYYLGRAIMRPRGALIGAIALLTMPSFLFGARQLTSGVPTILALVLALGGLAHFVWPTVKSGAASRSFALLVALAGLALGQRSAGLIVGVLVPIVAITAALASSRQGRARAVAFGSISVGLVTWVIVASRKYSSYSTLLAGVPRPPQFQTVVTTLLRQLGFASAPWLAMAPFAILRSLDGEQDSHETDDEARANFARTLLPAALAAIYLGATMHAAALGDLIVPAGPILGLLAGAWFDDALSRPASRAIEGVAIAALAIILGHDVMLTTDAFVSVQSAEQIRWPQPVFWTGDVLFGFMAAFGALAAASLILPLAWGERDETKRLRLQRGLLTGAVVVQLVFALVLVQWFVPKASKHLSPKDLYGKTRSLDPKAPLGQYHFNATGASYYMGGRVATSFTTLEEVLSFLRKPERVFVFVGSEELASVDQSVRGAGRANAPIAKEILPQPSYFVIDDSNSRFLILSNQLGAGENDLNPLRRFVSEVEPTPQTKLLVNFDDKLQLIGFDLPAEATRGADVKVRLYFKVLAPIGTSYKVFLHFDGPGARVNGDHVPLDGRFPTQYWTQGTYVIDEYLLKPDHATQPAGTFQLFFGLFSGDKRLKVKEGASDGENRIRVGSVRVK